ncbi:MAG: phage portal protein, partial [Planctomycetota bacterium]
MSGAAAVIDEAAAALATLASPETAKPSATYDAAEATGAGKRIRKSGRHKSEDKVLTPAKRGRMQTDAHDLRRNLAVAGWAMRMHVAHVAQHTLQVTTPDREFNRDLERLMKKRLKDPKAVDAAGRHTNDRLIWITELSATGDGDIFVNVLPDGRVQLIEGDRFAEPMRKPKGYDKDRVVHGVELDALGAAKRYCLT